jgi:ABC-type microcin C transport system permease subunit YejB
MKLPGGKVAIPGIIFALLLVLIFMGGTFAGKLTGHWKTAVSLEEYGRLIK